MSGTGGPEAVQRSFASAVRRFLSERATVIETTLFDLPGKMALGNYCGAHVIPELVRKLEERISAQELGRRRRVIGLPLALDLNGLLWEYEFGRLQRYLDAGWPDAEADLKDGDDAARVVSFWEGVTRSYRNDGKLVPEEGGAAAEITCLDKETVNELAARARARGRPRDISLLRRSFAQLEMYIFLVHAEARDGIFHHGPYPLGDGTVLVLKELTDLQNRFMPWMNDSRRLSTSRIAVPMLLQGVECRFDMFGTLYAEMKDYFDHITGFELLAGDELKPISEDELGQLGRDAQQVQRDLFREMARWDDHQKLFHATAQYANVLYPFLELAGFTDDDIRRYLMEPFVEVGERYVGAVKEKRAAPVWEYVASGREPLFPEIRV